MENRIKEISQKLNTGAFSTPIPLGCDSKYVDMHDSNTLEEEFKLGGSCITSLSTVDGNTTVTEEYRKEEETKDFYKVITVFSTTDSGGTQIKQSLYLVNDEDSSTFIKSKTVTFESNNGEVVIKEEVL
jgi:hypothetical protein